MIDWYVGWSREFMYWAVNNKPCIDLLSATFLPHARDTKNLSESISIYHLTAIPFSQPNQYTAVCVVHTPTRPVDEQIEVDIVCVPVTPLLCTPTLLSSHERLLSVNGRHHGCRLQCFRDTRSRHFLRALPSLSPHAAGGIDVCPPLEGVTHSRRAPTAPPS